MMNRVDQANVLQGTRSDREFSRGNTLPLIAAPWGMTHWSPQTSEGDWFFHPDHRKLLGIRATHQPSPWIRDYGHFSLLPQSGPLVAELEGAACSFRDPEYRPYAFSCYLPRYRVGLEMAPTERCAFFRFTFPAGQPCRVLLRFFEPTASLYSVGAHGLNASTSANHGGVPENFREHLALQTNATIESAEIVANGSNPVLVVEFAWGTTSEPIVLKLGTSFISAEQAAQNHEREIGDLTLEAVCERTKASWNALMERYPAPAGKRFDETVLASALYRAFLFPRKFHEIDASGNTVHYSTYNGSVCSGPAYTDNGFWDTHRTVYPFLGRFYPDVLPEMLDGWVNAYREGGWFPKWASPGYRACMIGTHLDAVFADAVERGIQGWDVETAYEGLWKHAHEPGDLEGAYGRVGIEDYLRLGYVPADRYEHAASRTCDFAYGDFCIGRIAARLGREDDCAVLMERAQNYRKVFDPRTGFIRGRNADGSFPEHFDPLDWGNPYVEGGAWQCGWAVQHDIPGMIELHGGREAFLQKLDTLLATPPHFNIGTYGSEIHEMAEMAAVDFGQYAHSNQPSHHLLYLFAAAGEPEKTRYWVDRVCRELYTADSFCGDEDNGEMACWYLLALHGIYPMAPGHDIKIPDGNLG
ncbi:MAG: GH92 family glycosyl hydrolase [Opitutales bacterium]